MENSRNKKKLCFVLNNVPSSEVNTHYMLPQCLKLDSSASRSLTVMMLHVFKWPIFNSTVALQCKNSDDDDDDDNFIEVDCYNFSPLLLFLMSPCCA